MVIVILGILAATAIPKFVDLSSNAETSAAAGVTGALAANITMLHAKYLISDTSYTVTNVMDIDSTGITLTNSGNVISTTAEDIGSGTYSWTYTDLTSSGAGSITNATKN